jgi:hypothetical protein
MQEGGMSMRGSQLSTDEVEKHAPNFKGLEVMGRDESLMGVLSKPSTA